MASSSQDQSMGVSASGAAGLFAAGGWPGVGYPNVQRIVQHWPGTARRAISAGRFDTIHYNITQFYTI